MRRVALQRADPGAAAAEDPPGCPGTARSSQAPALSSRGSDCRWLLTAAPLGLGPPARDRRHGTAVAIGLSERADNHVVSSGSLRRRDRGGSRDFRAVTRACRAALERQPLANVRGGRQPGARLRPARQRPATSDRNVLDRWLVSDGHSGLWALGFHGEQLWRL